MHAGEQTARAAVLRRQRHGKQAEFLQEFEHVLRIFGVAIDRVGTRRNLLARHAAHEFLHRKLLFGQRIHRWGSLLRLWSRSGPDRALGGAQIARCARRSDINIIERRSEIHHRTGPPREPLAPSLARWIHVCLACRRARAPEFDDVDPTPAELVYEGPTPSRGTRRLTRIAVVLVKRAQPCLSRVSTKDLEGPDDA